MRILMILVVGILAVGCGETELTEEEKQKALRDSMVGVWEHKDTRNVGEGGGRTLKVVFLENGIGEWSSYAKGKAGVVVQNKWGEAKWSISNGELHTVHPASKTRTFIAAWRINPDGSITTIAKIDRGKRIAEHDSNQLTYTKIK